MPNMAKTEEEGAKQKGEEGKGMRALYLPFCVSLKKLERSSSVAAQPAHMIIGLINFLTSESFVATAA